MKYMDIDERIDIIKSRFSLISHQEGGWFSEVYTSPFLQNDRATAGCIYFLLIKNEVSHFHKIDCDELWLYHEGCGMKITVLYDNRVEVSYLGTDIEKLQKPMIKIPAGAVFAAENLNNEEYTFISCVTTPGFQYDGFKLIGRNELMERYNITSENILKLSY